MIEFGCPACIKAVNKQLRDAFLAGAPLKANIYFGIFYEDMSFKEPETYLWVSH